jgi:hypothetical protein
MRQPEFRNFDTESSQTATTDRPPILHLLTDVRDHLTSTQKFIIDGVESSTIPPIPSVVANPQLRKNQHVFYNGRYIKLVIISNVKL